MPVRRWESEKHRSWCMPVDGFRDHVATDGPQLGVSGQWSACDWLVVQLDHDVKMGPVHEMHGTLEADLEVVRTIKRAELTAFFCLFRRIVGPPRLMWTTKESSMGLNCIGPKAKDADLWILIWQEVYRAHKEKYYCESSMSRRIVQIRRSRKWKGFVTEGNEGRRHGADQNLHSSAEKGGGVRGPAVNGMLSLFGVGVARL